MESSFFSLPSREVWLKCIFSLSSSCILLGILFISFRNAADAAIQPGLIAALVATSVFNLGLYLVSGVIQAWLRAWRYQVILASSSETVPGMPHLFLVSVSRNMFVDMLPARLGELSYVAMLNRGYKVAVDACLASLAVSFVFDIVALFFLVAGLLFVQFLLGNGQLWLFGPLLMIGLVAAAFLVLVFPVAAVTCNWLTKVTTKKKGLVGKVTILIISTGKTLQLARRQGIVVKVLSLSLAVRVVKYTGLYVLFLAVVERSFPDIITNPGSVLFALIGAEAGAALPVPSFMSFGTYEAGGALAMVALGAEKAVSVVIMLTLHIWSQVGDYFLGIIAFVVFVFSIQGSGDIKKTSKKYWFFGAVAVLLATACFLGLQYRQTKKIGALTPPQSGSAVVTGSRPAAAEQLLAPLDGFIVWSSNRFGNHDILKLSLPGLTLTRLTRHPHTEYFPRISPDGKKMVFCRSQVPWVSQRNKLAWDVYLFDLDTKTEQLLAQNGNVATWSADGQTVYFQRNGNQVVAYDLSSRTETVMAETGKSVALTASVMLETPNWSEVRQQLATTLRGAKRATVVVGKEGSVHRIGGGCQLTWAPDSSFLYYMDGDRRRTHGVYRVDPDSFQSTLWFDAPQPYSHEYFPKLANTSEYMVYGASAEGHEHDTADYEIFLWKVDAPAEESVRLSFHSGNDCWPDIFLN